MLTFERTEDRFAGHLLPPGAGLFVTHDEVLIVDARQVKVKLPSVYCRFPHQTGVTERSISGDNRSAADHVLHEMMVSHEANWVSDSFSVACHSQHHI